MWRLNNMVLNNQWITKEIKEEIKSYLEKMKAAQRDQVSTCVQGKG